MLIYKIKRAKESPEGFNDAIFDIIFIAAVLVIGILFSIYRIALVSEFEKTNYTSSSITTEEQLEFFAEATIDGYKMSMIANQVNGNSYNTNMSAVGLQNFIIGEGENKDVKVSGRQVICNFGTNQVIFTVNNNNITYIVK